MRVACALRDLRGERTLEQIASTVGISRGLLSEIERGIRFPADKHVDELERAYGAPWPKWYPQHNHELVRLSLVDDKDNS